MVDQPRDFIIIIINYYYYYYYFHLYSHATKQTKVTQVMSLAIFSDLMKLLQSHIKQYSVFAGCVVPSIIIKLTMTCGYIFLQIQNIHIKVSFGQFGKGRQLSNGHIYNTFLQASDQESNTTTTIYYQHSHSKWILSIEMSDL